MITVTLSPDAAPMLENMKRVLGVESHGEVIQQALMILQAAMNAHNQGMKTGFINEDGAVMPLFTPKSPVIDLEVEKEDEHAPISPKTE